jgi:hypothetical protein
MFGTARQRDKIYGRLRSEGGHVRLLGDILVDRAFSRIQSSPVNTPVQIAPGISMMRFVPQQHLSGAEWNFIRTHLGPGVYWVDDRGELRGLQVIHPFEGRVVICSIADGDELSQSLLLKVVDIEAAWLSAECKNFDTDGFQIEGRETV